MTTCIVCDANRASPIYGGLLAQCGTCGHVWADVEMGPEQLRALYGYEYFHGEEYSDYLADRRAIERNFASRLAMLERFCEPATHRKLLEIGCAYGLFLDLARSRFDHVAGIDITDEGVRFARSTLGLDVMQGDLVTTDWTGHSYDVVCAWDTIEHLERPDEYVRIAASLMPPGGLLALTTGDIGSLNARVRGDHWRLIHPPTHLHYFSVPTMTRLLERFGFEVVHLEHCGAFRRVGNMLHNVIALRWGQHRLGTRLAQSWVGRIQFYVNLFDVMYVIARKR